jgi:nucleoid-associated protein YgaU
MGLFSFFKNAGPKVFSGKKDAASTTNPTPISNEDRLDQANALKAIALRGVLDSWNLPVTDLSIEVDDDTVTVYGQTATQADREKVILAIGNVDGVATVDDQLTISASEPEPEARFYEVKKGDTLSRIAKEFFGNANKYPVIFDANRPMLKDPNLIYPGQMLRIPMI